MDLLPIPQEKIDKNKKQTKVAVKKVVKLGDSMMAAIKKKLALKETSRDEKIVGGTLIKMVKYIKTGGSNNLNELDKLLDGMQHSVIVIQKKKKKLIENSNKRLNKKNNRKSPKK